jgi:hypothetical protein
MNLHVYKFETKILENGIIQIPDFKNFVNKEIEILVFFKPSPIQRKKLSVDEFINKWAGFIKATNTDDLKYQYLNEKYK